MNDPTAAAPASTTPTPASPAPAAEPTLSDLARLIKSPAAAAAAKPAKPATRPAPAAAAEVDPDLEDLDIDPPAGDPPAEDPPAEDPAAEDPPAEEPLAEDPPVDETPAAEVALEDLDAEDLATRKAFTPEQQKKFDKALFKQREKARLEKSELEQQLIEARATPPAPAVPTADNPLADVATEVDLNKRLAEVRNIRRWALTHPNGGTIKDGDKEVEISAEKAAEMIADTEEILQVHATKRLEFIRQNAELEGKAVQDYPWLKSKASQGSIAVGEMLRQYGDVRLRDIPGIRGSLADLFIGQIIRSQSKQKTAAGAPAATPPKAPATPAGRRPPPKVSGPTKKAAEASKTLKATGADPGNVTLRALIGRA